MEIRAPKTSEEWNSYYDLRFRELRQPWNQPRGSEQNEGDKTAQHFALLVDDKIVAVSRLDILPNNVAQVRFVCTDSQLQGNGYGKKIMEACEISAKQQGCATMILMAREVSKPFYSKLGYKEVEIAHLLFDEIQHWKMEKTL